MMIQPAMAHNGASLMPGLAELLQQLLADRGIATLPPQQSSRAAGIGQALDLGSCQSGAHHAGMSAAAAQGSAGPRADVQRSSKRGKASAASAAASGKGPTPPPPATPDPSGVQAASPLQVAAPPQPPAAEPHPLAAAQQLCAAVAPQPQPAAAQQPPAAALSHPQPASQLHADAKVFTPRSSAAAAAAAATAGLAGATGGAVEARGHAGCSALCEVVAEADGRPISPPPSPCSLVAVARPLSPVPALQQSRHSTPSTAHVSALVLQQAAEAAAVAQVECSCSGGCGSCSSSTCGGSFAPAHPACRVSFDGVPLKQGVRCSISSELEELAGWLLPVVGRRSHALVQSSVEAHPITFRPLPLMQWPLMR